MKNKSSMLHLSYMLISMLFVSSYTAVSNTKFDPIHQETSPIAIEKEPISTYIPVDEKNVFVFWYQGESNMNDFVWLCQQTIQLHLPKDYQLVYINKDNYTKYLQPQDIPVADFSINEHDIAPAKDLIMYCLVYKYGGMALDASIVMLPGGFEYILEKFQDKDELFWVYFDEYQKNNEFVALWAMMAKKESPVIQMYMNEIKNNQKHMTTQAPQTNRYGNSYFRFGKNVLDPILIPIYTAQINGLENNHKTQFLDARGPDVIWNSAYPVASIKDTGWLWSKIKTRLENRKLAPFIKYIRCGGNEITLAKYNVQELMRDPNKFLVPIFETAFSMTHHQIAKNYTRNSIYSFEYDYTYIGGYNDMWKLRDLDIYRGTITPGNTNECYKICEKEKYHYFGIQGEYQCWCGNNYGTYGRRNAYDGCTNKKKCWNSY